MFRVYQRGEFEVASETTLEQALRAKRIRMLN